MRKRTMNNLFENLMWYLIYLMPLLLWVGVSVRVGHFCSLANTFDVIGLNILTDNVILGTFIQIFGVGGVIPLFVSSDILIYVSYFVSVYLIHLLVDFLLFIPKISHKWLSSLTSGGSD